MFEEHEREGVEKFALLVEAASRNWRSTEKGADISTVGYDPECKINLTNRQLRFLLGAARTALEGQHKGGNGDA